VPKVVRRVGIASHPKKDCSHLSQIRSREKALAGPGVMLFTRPAQDGSVADALGRYCSGRMCGKRITSRIDGLFVKSITSRSTPMPQPAVGGRPCSSARM